MLRYLLIILIIPVLANTAITVTSTQYRPNVTLADSGVNINGMIRHAVPSMALISSGSILIGYYKYTNSSTYDYRILKSSDGGNTWGTDITAIGATNQGMFCPIYRFGNDAYILSSNTSINDSILIRKYIGTTQNILDTLNFWKSGDVGKNGLNVLGGDTILFWICKERGTDTTFLILTKDFSQSATYIGRDTVQFNKGVGPALPMLDGIIRHEYSTEDLFWGDSLYGFDTISTTYLSGINITTVDASTNPDACILKDSLYLYVAQLPSDGTDSMVVFSTYITGTLDATGGNVSFSVIDTTTIEAAGDLPFVAGQSVCAQPKLIPLVGTDTVFLVYCWWSNQSNTDSANIVFKLSTNKGTTWGSRTILKTAVEGEQIMNLSASNAVSYNGYVEFWTAWTDSVTGTGNDSLEVMKTIWDSGVRSSNPTGVHYNPTSIMNIYTPAYVGRRY